ncbi:unnamed protein product [Acanthosepion pharaonis]|uniref:Uncharacterized protein n=1 Tax=Acanthosepion pharaonis TaxID=158019 RepID=A0A812BMM0_ACAPH|nr:unnamed protein product [Sepia pharaonis]
MAKIEALFCVCLLAGLTAPFFGESTTTDNSCHSKDLTGREKQVGQKYLQNNNRREISTGEQELSAFQISSTQATTHTETGDEEMSALDTPSIQATALTQDMEQEGSTSTASSHVTSLMPTAERKVSNFATVATQATASFPTREQELTAFPTTSPQTTSPFQNNKQEGSALPQVKFPTPAGEQELSFPSATTLQAPKSSQAEEQQLSTSQTASMMAFFILLSGVALFLLSILIKHVVVYSLKYLTPCSGSSNVNEGPSKHNEQLVSFRQGEHSNSYQEDDFEEFEMECLHPVQVPPSSSNIPSGGNWKSFTL